MNEIRVRSFIFPIKPFLYQNWPKKYKLEQFSTFKSNERPKNYAKKIVLVLSFDHHISKIYQKVSSYNNQRVWPEGFCDPLRPLCTLNLDYVNILNFLCFSLIPRTNQRQLQKFRMDVLWSTELKSTGCPTNLWTMLFHVLNSWWMNIIIIFYI